jgi:hypothetical protein
MAFQDFRDFTDAGLALPVNGKTYTIPPIDAATGLFCQSLLATSARLIAGQPVGDDDTELLDDAGERDLYRRLLGAAYEEMVADGVPWRALKLAAGVVFWDAAADRKTAERYWASGGRPEAAAPSRAERRATTRGTPAGAATTTPRASGSGTTRSTHRKPAGKTAHPSRGERSSPTGT